jgi:photosystem II stability/assembly factor-like uncharacterized protein
MTWRIVVFALLGTTPVTAQEIVLVPGFTQEFRGISSRGDELWASGDGGVFARSFDGGASWKAGHIPGADGLFLVDIEALGRDTACVLATSFDGGLGRAYRTIDGGRSWAVTFELAHPEAFLDAMAFWDRSAGVAFGDQVDGAFLVLRTDDGCETWTRVLPDALPVPLEGEAGLAASGTSITTAGSDHAWIGTGGGAAARVLRTADRGRTWTATTTPMPGAAATGIFGIAFQDTAVGMAVGGNYQEPAGDAATVLTTVDGGRSWILATPAAPAGVRFGAVVLADLGVFVAAGPSGLGFSRDRGMTWTTVDTLAAFALHGGDGRVWAAGPAGWIARVDVRALLDRRH